MYQNIVKSLSTFRNQLPQIQTSLEHKINIIRASLAETAEKNTGSATGKKPFYSTLSLSKSNNRSTTPSPISENNNSIKEKQIQSIKNLQLLLEKCISDVDNFLAASDEETSTKYLSAILVYLNFLVSFSPKEQKKTANIPLEIPEYILGLDMELNKIQKDSGQQNTVGSEKQMDEYTLFLKKIRRVIVEITTPNCAPEIDSLMTSPHIKDNIVSLEALLANGILLQTIQKLIVPSNSIDEIDGLYQYSGIHIETEFLFRQKLARTLSGREVFGFKAIGDTYDILILLLNKKLKEDQILQLLEKFSNAYNNLQETLSNLLEMPIEFTSSATMKSFAVDISASLGKYIEPLVQELKSRGWYDKFDGSQQIKMKTLVRDIIFSITHFAETMGEIRILHYNAWKHRELEQLKIALDAAQKEKDTAIEALEQLPIQLEATQEEVERLRVSLEEAQNNIGIVTDELAEKKDALATAIADLAKLRPELKEAKTGLSTSQNAQIENLKKIGQLERHLQRLNGEIERLRAKDTAPPAPVYADAKTPVLEIAAPLPAAATAPQEQTENTIFSIAIPQSFRNNPSWTRALGHTKRQNEVRNGRNPVFPFFTQTQFSMQKKELLQFLDETIEAQTPVSAQWWLELEVQAISKSGEGRFVGAFDESPLHASQTKTQFYQAYNAWREAATISLQPEMTRRARANAS